MQRDPADATIVANPWRHLPQEAPFVLKLDADEAARLGINLDATFKLQQMPEPFFGSPDADVVVLLLNPGWDPADVPVHLDPAFRIAVRDSLEHADKEYPFIHLAPGERMTPGRDWWERNIAAQLIAATSLQAVSRGLLCLQFMGYKSERYLDRDLRLPSQQYTFHLLRRAMQRNALVLIMRSHKLWCSEVPELEEYTNKAIAINKRRPYLSNGNFEPGVFEQIVQRIKQSG